MRTTGLWENSSQASSYVRKLRLPLGPGSYFQYKRGREYERKQADHAREQAKDSAAREREEAAREREYMERYTREREGDIAPERAEEMKPDR